MQKRSPVKNRQSMPYTVKSEPPEKLEKQPAPVDTQRQKPIEIGGPEGPEPTRFGDWEKAGRCSDF
jgi:hypothetical protein